MVFTIAAVISAILFIQDVSAVMRLVLSSINLNMKCGPTNLSFYADALWSEKWKLLSNKSRSQGSNGLLTKN